jgi:hypothetical protein
VVAVAMAVELAVSESGVLGVSVRARLGLQLERLGENALDADRFSAAEARELEPHVALPAVARALHGHRRALRQRAQVDRLAALCEQEPARLPLHPDGPDLERLADELAPQLDLAAAAP